MANSLVAFTSCSQSVFDSIVIKDPDTLYFTNDTNRIYKGDILQSNDVEVVNSLPSQGIRQGVIYILQQSKLAYYYNGSSFISITKDYLTSLNGSVDDTTIPTSKSVKDYADSIKLEAITNVTFMDKDSQEVSQGKLNVYKNQKPTTDNPDFQVQLSGVMNNATYDPTTRTFVFHMYGKQDLTVNLGVDLVVESGYYDESTEEIVLVLSDTQETEVRIPAGDLVNIYTVSNTNSITLNIDSNNNITASVRISNNSLETTSDGINVKISGKTGNKLSICTEAGNEGLYADGANTLTWTTLQ